MRILLISASARFLAASCVRTGWHFQALDFFADWDLKSYCQQRNETTNFFDRLGKFEELFDFGDFVRCDYGVFSGGLENHPDVIERLRMRLNVLGTSSEQLKRLIDPDQSQALADAIRNGGGSAPVTKTCLDVTDDPADWLCKKRGSTGGRHVRVAESGDIQREVADFVFQRRIFGELVSAVFVADGTRQNRNCDLLGVTRQLVGESRLGASPFAYCGSIGPLPEPAAISDVIANIGQSIATEFVIKGVFGIDLIVNAAGVWPVDINPRIPSSVELIELNKIANGELWICNRYGSTILGQHVAACLGTWKFGSEKVAEPRLPQVSGNEIFGKAILFWRMPKSLEIYQATFERIAADHWDGLSGQLPSRWVADIPCPGITIRSGDPVLTLYVKGESEVAVSQRLMNYAEELESILVLEV